MIALLKKYLKTIQLCASQAFDGNFLFVFAGYAVRLVRLLVITAVFSSLPDGAPMSKQQMLTYAVVSSAFSEQLCVYTPATTALWEGSIIYRFTRPLPVIGDLIAETVGRWVPSLLFYTLPVYLLSPLLGISVTPNSVANGLLFACSLLLGVSLGFCVDFVFSAVAMHLKNGCWAALFIREGITALLSGSLIPFALLPSWAGDVFTALPFAFMAGAPLSIYVGNDNTPRLLLLSLLWNATLWPLCILFFNKSQERMVSYGG